MRGAGEWLDLQVRVAELQTEVEVLGSVLDDLTSAVSTLPPPDPPAEPAPPPHAATGARVPDTEPNPVGDAQRDPAAEPPGDVNGRAAPTPRDEEARPAPAPVFASLEAFVAEHFAPVYTRAQSPTLRWCACWWDHAEAIYRLEALWRSWETCRLDPRLGMAGWLRDHLDPQLAVLTSPTGPFMQCTADRHSPLKPLPVLPAPPGHWDPLPE